MKLLPECISPSAVQCVASFSLALLSVRVLNFVNSFLAVAALSCLAGGLLRFSAGSELALPDDSSCYQADGVSDPHAAAVFWHGRASAAEIAEEEEDMGTCCLAAQAKVN